MNDFAEKNMASASIADGALSPPMRDARQTYLLDVAFVLATSLCSINTAETTRGEMVDGLAAILFHEQHFLTFHLWGCDTFIAIQAAYFFK